MSSASAMTTKPPSITATHSSVTAYRSRAANAILFTRGALIDERAPEGTKR